MRFATVFAAFAAVSSVSAATLNGDLRALLVRQNPADIPTCADDCFANPPETNCNGSNKCLCENEAFVAGETQCLQAACSGADLAAAEAFSRQLCLSVGVTLTQTSFPASTDSSTSATDSASSTDSSTSAAAASTTDSSSAAASTTASAPAGSSTPVGTVSGTSSGASTVAGSSTTPKTSATGSGTQSSSAASASSSTSGASSQRFSVLALVGAVVLGACTL